MATDECRSAKCCVHQLKFATLPEFPDDTPDFSDVVGGFAMRRSSAPAFGVSLILGIISGLFLVVSGPRDSLSYAGSHVLDGAHVW